MSREQWGHGYWKGREDERKNPEGYRYIGCYDSDTDPYINRVAMIRERRPNAIVVEWLHYLDILLAISGGYEMDIDPYNPDMIEEIDNSSLDKFKSFYSWDAVVSEVLKAEKIYKRKCEATI